MSISVGVTTGWGIISACNALSRVCLAVFEAIIPDLPAQATDPGLRPDSLALWPAITVAR